MSFTNVPAALRELPQWVIYGRPGTEPGSRPWKTPYRPQFPELKAAANQSRTWSGYDLAVDAHNKAGFAGIGFVFAAGGGLVGVDLDNCLQGGQLDPGAAAWVERFNSYTEVSPSGKGLHIFCRGELPGKGVKKPLAEMYDRGRYFTITGDSYGPPRPLQSAQEAIDALYAELTARRDTDTGEAGETPTEGKRKPVGLSDDELLEKAMRSQHRNRRSDGGEGATFAELWAGDISRYNDDDSAADQALCNMLAFWTNCGTERIDRLFRQSALYRPKWDEVHGADTYGGLTISEAISTMTGPGYDPDYKPAADRDFPPAVIRPLSGISPKPVDWLWYPYIPRGKITLVNADPGAGKTYLLLKLASLVSTGAPFYEDPAGISRKPGTVLLQNAEDGIADTIVPRLLEMSPDMTRIHNIDERDRGLTFDDPRIGEAMQLIQPTLAIFDPIQEYIGGDADMNRANQVRPTMSRLMRQGEPYETAMLLVMHLSKMTKASTFYRALGSIDFVSAARSMLTIVKDPDNPGGRLMCHDKSSLAPAGPSVRFHIDPANGGVVFDGYSPLSADEALAKLKGGYSRSAPTLQDVMAALNAELDKEGCISIERARGIQIETGCGKQTLYDAKNALRLQSASKGKDANRKTWWIPDDVDRKEFLALH